MRPLVLFFSPRRAYSALQGVGGKSAGVAPLAPCGALNARLGGEEEMEGAWRESYPPTPSLNEGRGADGTCG